MQSRGLQLAIQVISILLFALISALAPQEYFMLFFLIYFVVIMFVFSRTMSTGFKKPDHIKTQPMYKEDDASKIMSSDLQLLQEVREQFKPMMILMAMTFLVLFIVAPLYHQYIARHVESYVSNWLENETLTRFFVSLLFYVFLITVMYLPRTLVMRGLKQKKQIYTPRRYSVHKEGLLIDNRVLEYKEDLCLKIDNKRRFVEIHGEKLPFILRLYTIDPSKLASRLEEVGLRECRA